MLALSISPISVHIFTVFGRHTSRFVVWGFESFLVSLKMGLFLCFCFVLLFVASGRFGGVWVRRKGVKMSLLSLPGYICDVHASTVSPSCAPVGTGPHSQISDRILRFSQVFHICHIWRVSKLCRFNMGYQKVERGNCLNAAPPSQNFLPNWELKVCVCAFPTSFLRTVAIRPLQPWMAAFWEYELHTPWVCWSLQLQRVP